jgi:hypothetical protein
MVLLLLAEKLGWVGRLVVTGQLPFSPVVFWLLAELAELCPTEARLPVRARRGKSSKEISDAGAPKKNFRAAGPGRNDRG